MNINDTAQDNNTIHAADPSNLDSATIDLFAEELPEQHDHAPIPGICCVFCASSFGGCVACLGSLSTTC